MVMGYIWIRLSPPKDSVELSVVISDKNNTKKLNIALKDINLILIQKIEVLMEIDSMLAREYSANTDLLTDELIDLDNNKSTFEVLYFEGDLNVSTKSFHSVWIVQHHNELNSYKVIFHDTNTTFPLVIKKSSNKRWCDIETQALNNKIKYWEYKNGEYQKQKRRKNEKF